MKKTNHPQWKLFERMVASIETIALDMQATVSCPDHLPDITTGAMREVDATIRATIGTVPILIAIECRLRSRPADTTWIEQLVTKRQQIGASKIVAVSSSGFSAAAFKVAAQHGIEIRTLTQVDPKEVAAWFSGPTVVHLVRSIDNLETEIVLADGSFVRPSASDPCFAHPLVHAPFPPALFVQFLELGRPEAFLAVPRDGTQRTFNFELVGDARDLIPVPLGVLRPEHADLAYLRDDQWVNVRNMRLTLTLSYMSSEINLNEGEHYEYRNHVQPTKHLSSFHGNLKGMPVRFEHHSGHSLELKATATFPSGVTLQSKERQSQIVRRLDLDELVDEKFCFSPVRVSFKDGTHLDGVLLAFSASLRSFETELGQHLKQFILFVSKQSVPKLAKMLELKNSLDGWPMNARFIKSIPRRDVHQVLLLRLNDA